MEIKGGTKKSNFCIEGSYFFCPFCVVKSFSCPDEMARGGMEGGDDKMKENEKARTEFTSECVLTTDEGQSTYLALITYV